jgi:hypothetical protein
MKQEAGHTGHTVEEAGHTVVAENAECAVAEGMEQQD